MRISQLTQLEKAERKRNTTYQATNGSEYLYFIWNPRACKTSVIGGPSNGTTTLLGPDYRKPRSSRKVKLDEKAQSEAPGSDDEHRSPQEGGPV